LGALARLPALQAHTFYHRLFTPLATLWYLLFQRLNADHSLDAALTDAQNGGADRLNPKLSRQPTSQPTCSCNDARQPLPWEFLLQALALQGRKMTRLSPTTRWRGLVLALLDGSTVRLRPYGDIPEAFPPHRNQARRRAYWCPMRVVVCFCALSGATLHGARGPLRWSEQVLACQIIPATTAPCLFIGDRPLGVFRIVPAVRHVGQHALLRLTQSRARRRLEDWLSDFGRTPGKALAQWPNGLQPMSGCRLPHRPKPRPSEPRAQRHLRLPYPPLFGSRAQARRQLKKYDSKS
jgi:hypothetical protein